MTSALGLLLGPFRAGEVGGLSSAASSLSVEPLLATWLMRETMAVELVGAHDHVGCVIFLDRQGWERERQTQPFCLKISEMSSSEKLPGWLWHHWSVRRLGGHSFGVPGPVPVKASGRPLPC